MERALDFQEIEEVLERIGGENMDFGAMVENAMKGGSLTSAAGWMKLLGNAITTQLQSHGQAILALILLIASAALLSVLAKALKNRQVSDMEFYLIFLLLFLILMKSFESCYELTEQVINDMVDFMKVLMPTYLMSASLSAYSVTAVAYYEGFLLLIYYLQRIVASAVLPLIRCYVLLAMLGHLAAEDYLSRGREGLKKLIQLLLKAMIMAAGGIQMIQGMISPAIDQMKHTVISRGVSSLGSIGDVAQNVTDVILGSGVLLKNGIGAAATVVIISICLIPAAEVGCYGIFYQFLAAAAEPVSDKRLVSVMGQMGEGIGLLVKLLFTVSAMFLLTIAMVCVTTGGLK